MTIRFRHILLCAVSLLCLSCSGDDSFTSVMEYPVEVELGCDMTKVGIDGNDLFWESGDQVAFRAVGASGVTAVAVLTLNDVDSGLGRAKFKGSVVMTEMPVSCEFAYPADAFAESGKTVYDYSVQDGTHKPYLYGTQEYSENGMECTLGHVGGLIRIKVADGVESLSVSSNSGIYETQEDGSSKYVGQKISKVLRGDEGVVAAEDASHLIFVSVPAGSDVAYAFVPAIEFVEGISIVCSHEDGSKMFKSFSTTGGNYSSYDFDAGSAIDVDLSEYSGFKADCTCIGYHTYDDSNILTGTDVLLTDFTFSGSPSKIIDQWGVAIYDSKNNFIRWTSENSIFNKDDYINQDESEKSGKKMDDYTGNWPLLIPGEQYSVYAICSINGHTLQFKATSGLSIGYPNIQVTPIAETSWTYRSDPKRANSSGNNTIERLGVKVNVADNILNHITTNYGFKARMQNTTTDSDSGELTMNTNFTSTSGLNLSYNTTTREYDLKNGDGLYVLQVAEDKWGAQNVLVSVSFAGNTYSGHTTAYVTGLPYRHDFRAAEGLDGGMIVGDETYWHKYNGYELYYYYLGTKEKQTFYSRKFPLPESIDVKYTTTFFLVNTTLFSTSTFKSDIYTGIVSTTSEVSVNTKAESVTADKTKNVDTLASAQATTPHVLTGTGTLSKSNMISASTGNEDPTGATQNGAYIGAIEILYN